jgi:hypothetical protein
LNDGILIYRNPDFVGREKWIFWPFCISMRGTRIVADKIDQILDIPSGFGFAIVDGIVEFVTHVLVM